ncbi:hypothetical protein E8E13_010542 [Curvularia kusanoi]|uniref:Uncharacterized protein n=1 Tax=Curvularia kusanoi TaxID=90978 RepID=A0A9P4WA74_CURKU|nr:hypothetical protein E8E13_010542 [Curvularia kusanoi]
MAAANGTFTPPALPTAPESPSAAKRKHADTAVVLNGATQKHAPNGTTHAPQAVLEDVLSILKSYDTQPSILEHPIVASTTRSPSGEADSKRVKRASSTDPATIADRVHNAAYDSLQALERDVEHAVKDILTSIDGSDAPATLEEAKLQAKVLAFQKVLKGLVEREEARVAQVQQDKDDATTTDEAATQEDAPPQVKQEEVTDETEPSSRTVLTLFGSAQGPKQLFSSLQQPRKIAPADGIPSFDASIEVTLPLREATLPQNIQTTEVFALADQADEKKKVTTIGEVFRAPAHLPQISPPKIARPTTSKGNTITFAHPEPTKPKRKGSQSYAHQSLSAGFWLGYGGVDVPKDQTSPTARQKSRQRALSTGEAQQPPSDAILVAVQQAKEDALFRSVYSSFAPTRDDAVAIVPEETKNRVWWQKVGEKRFNEVFPIDPQLMDGEELVEGNGNANEEEDFKAAVENFVPNEDKIFPDEKEQHEKDIDEILAEVSELIETLASYQKIRNSSLTTNPRTPVVQNSSLAQLVGSPSTPSSDEIDVYQILKSQLTLMVSQLPPYAVAKLNGDQLDELNISRTILFDTKEYKGVMEEDQLSRLAKAPAVAAAPTPTLNRAGSSSSSLYPPGGSQYGRPSSSARPVQAAPAYHSQRSSSIQYQRSPSGHSQSFPAAAGQYSTPARPGYAAAPSHNMQTPRPGGQYYQQRPSQSGSYASSQFYGGTPQTQNQNRYAAQQNQNGYYQRSANVAPMYGTPQARTGSPIKPGTVATPSGYGTRTGYAPSGGQMASTYYGPSQYGTPQAPVTRTGYAGMSSNPQQMMMDRQQAQVAAQSQARLAAQTSFSSGSGRQDSGTPQPPSTLYGAPNGTSMST